MRQTYLPFALPDVTEAEISAAVETLRSGWLTSGPRVKAFEQAFARYLGVPRAVALNSGTAGLHLALEAIGLRPGDEVIVPTYTFTACAEVVRYFGARPVLVDVCEETLNIDANAVSDAISERTRAIIGVDLGGQPADWDRLKPLAQRHSLFLVDDAAHALPSSLADRVIGQWADITVFSFYATKTLTTGEGGMLVTANDAWADRAQMMSLHGISRDAWKRYTAEGNWYYEVMAPGFKYNMTDLAAAIGLVQLERLDQMNRRRATIAEQYSSAFAQMSELQRPTIKPDRTTSWHLYLLRLRLDQLRCDRAQFITELKARNVATSVHFIPLHLHPYYRETYGYQPEAFPVAHTEYWRVVSLPIYSKMSDADVADVIDAVVETVTANRR
jgi:perosamine synthetase